MEKGNIMQMNFLYICMIKYSNKYMGRMQHDVSITDEDADATFTFSFIGQATEGEEPEQKMKKLRVDMQKVWKQAVFYEMGDTERNK